MARQAARTRRSGEDEQQLVLRLAFGRKSKKFVAPAARPRRTDDARGVAFPDTEA
jgi:hypothetical protein